MSELPLASEEPLVAPALLAHSAIQLEACEIASRLARPSGVCQNVAEPKLIDRYVVEAGTSVAHATPCRSSVAISAAVRRFTIVMLRSTDACMRFRVGPHVCRSCGE